MKSRIRNHTAAATTCASVVICGLVIGLHSRWTATRAASPAHPAGADVRAAHVGQGVDSTPASPYAVARASFHTHLLRTGPAPQPYRRISAPPDAAEFTYTSAGLKLRAWLSLPPVSGQRRAAVLFLHGGFGFDQEDWEMTKPYRDAGFVVLAPMLRGENGLPGNFSLFFREVDDVLAAADALAALPYVRADHMYIAGHSAGGTLTMLAAMASTRFRAAAAFSGSPDQGRWASGQLEIIPFDPSDPREFQIRSPMAYPTSDSLLRSSPSSLNRPGPQDLTSSPSACPGTT